MVVYLKATGQLAAHLRLDEGAAHRRVELATPQSLADILAGLGLPDGLVALAHSDGELRRLSYRPTDGETITLQAPAAGG